MKIGFASFAHMHAWSYLKSIQSFKDVEIIAVAEENVQNQNTVKKLAEEKKYIYCSTYKELCEREDVDTIIISTENVNHARVAILALENNKHAIVEKPIATTIEDADAMIEAGKQSKAHLVQCYPCRYHPTTQKIKECFEEHAHGEGKEDVGKILAISATNHGMMPDADGVYSWFSDKKLAGGGALMDHITHISDLIFWWTNAKVRSVYATAENLFHPERDIDDAGMVTIEYDNDMIVSIDPSWSRPKNFSTWGDLTMTIFCTKRTVTLDMFAQSIDIQSDNHTHPIWDNYGTNMDTAMLRDFIDKLKVGEKPMLTGEDGRKSLQIALAAYESSQKNEKIDLI